jgi:hypothetical protein
LNTPISGSSGGQVMHFEDDKSLVVLKNKLRTYDFKKMLFIIIKTAKTTGIPYLTRARNHWANEL